MYVVSMLHEYKCLYVYYVYLHKYIHVTCMLCACYVSTYTIYACCLHITLVQICYMCVVCT